MKHNRILSFALIGSAILLAVACVEEITPNEELNELTGTPIVFSAATGYNNGVETRAEYSGQLYGAAPGFERINWDQSDPIKITYGGDAAYYSVSSVSGTTDKNSYAQISQVSGDDFYWASSGPHVFYGLYPCGSSANGTLTTAGHVEGTIPNSQPIDINHTITVDGLTKYQPDTDNYGYMAAYLSLANSQSTPVQLPFRPAVTTFEFKLQRIQGDTELKIRSVTLSTEAVGGSTTPLAGTFQFDITGGTADGATWGAVSTGSTSNSITATFPVSDFPDGASLPTDGYLDFSILALPVDLTGVKVTVTYANGTSKTLPLKKETSGGTLDWHTFIGAKKYIISNTVPGTEVWHYVVEPIDDVIFTGHVGKDPIAYNVKSYKWSERTGQSTKVAVPWKTQYSLYDETTGTWSSWADVPSNGTITGSDYSINNAAITGTGVNTSSYATGEARSAALNGESIPTGDTEHSPSTIIADLASRTPKGSAGSPYDLSMHDIFGNPHSQTTANSYIVTAPGTYKFPVVYGNAITNGDTDYTEAFWPASNGSEAGSPSQISNVYADHKNVNTFRYLARFIRADGSFMTVARIDQDMNPTSPNAAIVWQNRMELTPGEGPGPIVQESSVSYNNGYITFTVRPEDIRPGNVVIAFRGGTSTGLAANTILWSWQIWICPDDLTPVQFSNGALLPYNLGYIDSTGAGIQNYPNRLIKFKIVQVEDNIQHETEDFTIEEIGDGRQWDASVGFNVYYQWGRKDPMIPAKDYGATTLTPPSPATGTRDVYPDAAIYPGTGYTINVHGTEVAGGIIGSYIYPNTNYTPGITQPYIAYINPQSTGWVGGYVNGNINGNTTYTSEINRQFSSIACNLWNNGVYTTMDGTNAMWKTVYDPCPPGFCVPTAGVLGNLTADNLVARTSDGAYFGAPNGTRLFMPYSGLRVYYADSANNNYLLWAEEVRKSGWYWTDLNNADVTTTTINLPESCQYARSFSFGRTNINPILPISSSQLYTRGSSLAIRPMVDPKYAASSSPSSSAAPRGNINPFNNGGEIPE